MNGDRSNACGCGVHNDPMSLNLHHMAVKSYRLENVVTKSIIRTVFLVVILKVLVGMRTGPLTLSCLSFALLIRSAQTITEIIFRYII